MISGFDLPNLETLRVVYTRRIPYRSKVPRCTAFIHPKPKVVSIVDHDCPGNRHNSVPHLPVPSERLVFVQGIDLVGPWNRRPVPSFGLEQLYPAREHAQLRVEIILWSLYAIAWNRNGIKRYGVPRALTSSRSYALGCPMRRCNASRPQEAGPWRMDLLGALEQVLLTTTEDMKGGLVGKGLWTRDWLENTLYAEM
jgi:hypothetical protein